MKKLFCSVVAFASLALAGLTPPAQAETEAEFYKGKKIKFIIGSAPGGNYDTWARLVGRHMTNYIPSNPKFIAQNMPGGGHIKASNYLYNVAAKDGTVIGTISRNMPTRALLNHPAVKFDPVKFRWLGSPEMSNRACMIMKGAKVQKAEDLFKHQALMGGAGAGTAVSTTPNVLRTLLGMKMKLIEGYAGATDVGLAMERGEVEGICQTYGAFDVAHPGWIKSGKAIVLFNLEPNPITGTNIPSVFKFVKSEEQRKILSFYSSNIEIGRPTVAPPGISEKRLATLRGAFNATMKDKAFIKGAKKQGLTVTPLSGAEQEKRVKALAATDPDTVRKTEAMLSKLNPVFTDTVKVTGIKRKGRRVMFMLKGKAVTIKVSKSRTKVTIGGKKAKRSKIKAGMTCKITHLGPNSRAKKIACK
jgi:tripartite-type tricarboxylate transporter receptor subunit TctC